MTTWRARRRVDLTGALAVIDDTGTELRRVAAWGGPDGLAPVFAPHDCWALRRGQPHEIDPLHAEIHCRHFLDQPPPTALCIPLTVRGATLGLLHLSTRETLSEARLRELRTLAITVSESIKLAIAHLRPQEFQSGSP